MISYSSDKKSIKEIVELIDKGYLLVGNYLEEAMKTKHGSQIKLKECMESQRRYTWEKWRVGSLIQSILMYDDSIPELTVYRNDDRSQFRKVLDGQQRLTSIWLFVNNMISLDMSRSIYRKFEVEGEEYSVDDINGKTFSELPELWRDIFMGKHLRWICVNNCDEDTAEKLFVQLNSNVKSLRPAEIRYAGMGKKVRNAFKHFKKSDWLLHAFTQTSINGNKGNEIYSHIVTLLDNDLEPISLASDNINKALFKYRESGLPSDMFEKLNEMNLYLNEATEIWIDEKKMQDDINYKNTNKRQCNYNTYRYKFLNQTNTVMLMYSALIALKHKVNVADFADWAKGFFTFQTEEYMEACGIDCENKKASDEECVRDRMRIICSSMASLHSMPEKEYPDVDILYKDEEVERLMSDLNDPFENMDLASVI